jgi:hypothetical protein
VLVENQLYPNVEVNFGRGLLYRSGMRPVQGRQAIYVTEERTVVAAPTLPRYLEKQHAGHG